MGLVGFAGCFRLFEYVFRVREVCRVAHGCTIRALQVGLRRVVQVSACRLCRMRVLQGIVLGVYGFGFGQPVLLVQKLKQREGFSLVWR